MALDPEDRKAVETVAREAMAGAIDAVATVLEAGMPPATAARLLYELAGNVRSGQAQLGGLTHVSLVSEDVIDAEVGEADPEGHVQAIDAATFGNTGGVLKPLGAEEFDPAMVTWLDLFDDRIRGSAHFVEAVNEAADAGRLLDENTARMVAARVAEMRDQAAAGTREA